jgi:hypothetical protein
VTCGVLCIGLLLRYFLEHGVYKQVDPCVILNKFLEFFDNRMKVLRILVHMFNNVRDPVLDVTVVCEQVSGGDGST